MFWILSSLVLSAEKPAPVCNSDTTPVQCLTYKCSSLLPSFHNPCDQTVLQSPRQWLYTVCPGLIHWGNWGTMWHNLLYLPTLLGHLRGKKNNSRKISLDKFNLSNKHWILQCRLCQWYQVRCIHLLSLAFFPSILEKVNFQSTFPSLHSYIIITTTK